MNYAEFNTAVNQARIDTPSWRYGQTLFNVLYTHCPELADSIRCTELDTFHIENKERITKFWEFIFKNLEAK